ncbi:MAG: hypothetical protein JSV81_02540, partial [Anaerolineales bacterium]
MASGLVLFLALILMLGISLSGTGLVRAQADPLTVEIIAAYNFVVDSNVESPSTYAPSVATIAGKFCNTGATTLTGVQGFIGDSTNGTPGIYPVRATTDPGFLSQHPLLDQPGSYSFSHVGGRAGLADATRFVGTLAPGECRVQYWHITYPQCESSETPPCSLNPVWGLPTVPEDDLWLTFDIWATANEVVGQVSQTWRATMRNEISAMANKIFPQGSSWFNTNTDIVVPGDLITSNGVRYELGNINKGFDNDGDGDFDYNAWLQPIGDPSFDPSCFRLVRTSGVFTVARSAGQPDLVIPFEDQLYFTDLPSDNTGAIGDVFYTFMALDGPCATALTPYQEVASGADNEKFNADYGTGIPPLGSSEPEVEVDKTGNLTVTLGGTIDYQVAVDNTGDTGAGLPLISGGGGDVPWVPLVISDTIPEGTIYVSGSATHTFTSTGVIIRYSTDDGATWTDIEPPAADVTTIQWWLTDTLQAGHSGEVLFRATVPTTFTGSYIENCSDSSFAGGPSFNGDCSITLVEGNNTIGGTVWQDENGNGLQEGGEGGLPNVTVSVYLDTDGDGVGDLLVVTATTSITGYYAFEDLPNGDFVVQVDTNDPDLPPGYSSTTDVVYPITLSNNDVLDANFGFGPSLSVDKRVITSPVLEGNLVTYTIRVTNLRPGDGTGQPAPCQYTIWSTTQDPDHSGSNQSTRWVDEANVFGTSGPDGIYAYSDYGNARNRIAGTGFDISKSGTINSVEAIFSIYVDGVLINDSAEGFLYFNDAQIALTPFTPAQLNALSSGPSNQGLLSWDVTSARAWDWPDFSGNLDLELDTIKQAAVDGGTVYLDAMGFRITTDELCGGPSDTINPAPLSDVYDADRLEFVSAQPPESTFSTGGSTPYANTG